MKNIKSKLCTGLILSVFIFIFSPTFAFADVFAIGSSDYFTVTSNGKLLPTDTFRVEILQCENYRSNIEDPKTDPSLKARFQSIIDDPANKYDPGKDCYWVVWRVAECSEDSCYAFTMAGHPNEIRFRISIPNTGTSLIKQQKEGSSLFRMVLDGDAVVFTSEVVERKAQNVGTFQLALLNEGIVVNETTPFWETTNGFNIQNFIIATLLTILIESAFVFLYIKNRKLPKKIIVTTAVASIISLPIIWFIFPLVMTGGVLFLVAESFVVLFEGCVLYFFNKQFMGLKESMKLSFKMNVVSVFFGTPLLVLIGYYVQVSLL